MSELISVIVPIHNVAPYLHKCVDSVLKQSYTDLDILLIDDGSEDESGKICDEYASGDRRIRVLHKRRGGLSDARNAGLRAACGKYIYFLDGDDYIGEGLLRKAHEELTRENADVCCWGYTRISENGNILSKQSYETGEFAIETSRKKFDFLTERYLTERCGSSAWSRLYKAAVIKENNLLFEDDLTVQGEDTLFNMRYLLYIKKVCVIDETAYYYRMRNNSLSKGLKQTELRRYHRSMLYLWSYFDEAGMREFQEAFYIIYGIFMLDGWRYLLMRRGICEMQKQMGTLKEREFADTQLEKILYNRKKIIKYCGIVRGRICLHMAKMICRKKSWYDSLVYWIEELFLRMSAVLHKWGKRLC